MIEVITLQMWWLSRRVRVTKQHVTHLMELLLETDVCGGLFWWLHTGSHCAEQVGRGVAGFWCETMLSGMVCDWYSIPNYRKKKCVCVCACTAHACHIWFPRRCQCLLDQLAYQCSPDDNDSRKYSGNSRAWNKDGVFTKIWQEIGKNKRI